ncbi:MAG: SURF1 family cytochrome oxidase biogenesis protein [Hyphomicrobiaceae bacterium]|nr:SURF1 family cytochrome oxidase biogenesis protein [Hyphomicrobiaceae bacterium]
MLDRFRAAGLIAPSLLAVLGLAILVSLGTWQIERKAQKDKLIATIAEREAKAPVGLEAALDLWQRGADAAEFTPVAVQGTFAGAIERLYYAPHPVYGPGSNVFSPLQVAPHMVVWVDRGFLPARLREPRPAEAGQPVDVVGLLRAPGRRGRFDPDNNVAANQWYWRDLAGMHASAFPDGKVEAAPFFIEARQVTGLPADGWPRPEAASPKPPNRHLEYAVTWFGLALTLLGVYVAFAVSRIRARD